MRCHYFSGVNMGRSTNSRIKSVGAVKIKVTLIPETWIIAPIMPKSQLLRYAEKGWLDREVAEHLDRAFPRNANGEPIIFKMWLEAPLKRAISRLGYDRSVMDFDIIDEKGIPVEYVVIPDKPLIYRRVILTERPSTELFEYIDSTFEINFTVTTPHPKKWMEAFSVAGRIGLMSRTRKGFGKFRVKYEVDVGIK